MKNFISKTLYILPKGWIRSVSYIIILTCFNAIFELFGIGLVIPFLTIFMDEESTFIEYFPLINNLEKEYLIIIFLFLFLIIFSLKNLFSVFFQKLKINFAYDLAKNVSTKLYLQYLKKNYIFFTLKNTSELIRNSTAETHLFSFGVIVPILALISDIIIFLAILIFLIFYNPIATLIASFTMILFGLILVFFQLKKLKLFGSIRQLHENFLLKLVTESIGNIKEIILSNNQKFFVDKFFFHNTENAKAGKKRDFFYILTRPILEVLSILMFLILVYILVKFENNSSEIFIILGVFSFASIKLVPTISNLMKGIQGLRYNSVVVDLIYDELTNDYERYNIEHKNKLENKDQLQFKKINFVKVGYSYPSTTINIFNDIDIEINKGEKVGFIGQSGSGKTTLINLITGLLKPSTGIIKLNNKNLQENISEWQKIIGYVSQNVYLADESILFNLTLKKIGEKNDMDRVNHLVNILDLNELVKTKKDGLSTTVGDKGITVSGGQMQRIGIARALYDKPKILILDEATNALDYDTQNKVLKNMYEEMKEETVISVSHDKNALKYCEKVYSVKKNKIDKIIL
ncbi:ABC transporter ATP-binding protein/permease [Candidatus Pelagibacter sp.]|nr:ABC transporter ATP-binding protein/permease [Candidatus Pelagibacter sp.]